MLTQNEFLDLCSQAYKAARPPPDTDYKWQLDEALAGWEAEREVLLERIKGLEREVALLQRAQEQRPPPQTTCTTCQKRLALSERRICPACQKPLVQRANEHWSHFEQRKTCGRDCGLRYRRMKREQNQ